MKKIHVLIAIAALLAATAVGYAASKASASTPKALGCCPSSCPPGACDGCGSCSR
jgi:hypothetical protein